MMEDTVLIEDFSGDKKISERKISLYEYYDGDVPELDDENFITENKITKVVFTNNYFNEKGYNFYKNGSLEKSVTITDGALSRVDFWLKDEYIFSWLDIVLSIENNIGKINLKYKLNEPHELNFKGKISCGEVFNIKTDKLSDEISFENIEIKDVKNCEFSVDVIIDGAVFRSLK